MPTILVPPINPPPGLKPKIPIGRCISLSVEECLDTAWTLPNYSNDKLCRQGDMVEQQYMYIYAYLHIYIYIYIYILRGCAHGRAAHAEARGEQFLSMLRPLNSLKISKR